MPLIELNSDTIGDLGGGTARPMINQELAKAVDDLYDRGEEDGKPRQVIIKIDLVRKEHLIVAQATAEAKLPPRRAYATSTEINHKSGQPVMLFQSANPERADQPTFEDVTEDGEIK